MDTLRSDPESKRRHQDQPELQRPAHEIAAYDAWFRAEVEKAIEEADRPDTVWVSHEEVERRFAARRAEWRKKVVERSITPP